MAQIKGIKEIMICTYDLRKEGLTIEDGRKLKNIMKIIFIPSIIIFTIFLPHSLFSQDRAPSLYLNYQDEGQGDILINTLRVQSPSPLYTYYCGLLWNGGQDAGGYCGMQEHPNGRNFIYSLWDPVSSSDPITAEYTHPNTDIAVFGGEGTGLRSLNFGIGWETDQWYSLVSRAWTTNVNSTLFGYWVYDQSNSIWHHLVTMNYPVPNLNFNTKTSSFIEDWYGNGYEARTIHHNNGWKRIISDASWLPFEESYFDRVFPDSGTVNYIENYDGGVINDEYYFMRSGGTTTPQTNEDDVTLFLEYNTTNPGFETGEFNNLTIVVDNDILIVGWDIEESKSPQFAYHIKIYDNIALSGTPVISIDNTKPHLRNDTIDISTLPNNSEYFVQFYITDIFDNISVTQVESFIKGSILSVSPFDFTKNIKVFPNPVTDKINIYLNQNLEYVKVLLLNTSGKIIYEEEYMHKNTIHMPVDIASGMYFLKFKGKNYSTLKTFKFLKK